jgi:hypothetical protein
VQQPPRRHFETSARKVVAHCDRNVAAGKLMPRAQSRSGIDIGQPTIARTADAQQVRLRYGAAATDERCGARINGDDSRITMIARRATGGRFHASASVASRATSRSMLSCVTSRLAPIFTVTNSPSPINR